MAIGMMTPREIHCKLVYYGVDMGGKTTNVKYLHQTAPQSHRTDLLSTIEEQTLSFDFIPLDVDQVHGFLVRVHLYTTLGTNSTALARQALLGRMDGVVFVADSQPSKMRENLAMLKELAETLEKQGKRFRDVPLVLQYNKRDLPDALPLEQMDYYLNSNINVPRFEAIATKGEGVVETLKEIRNLVISKL